MEDLFDDVVLDENVYADSNDNNTADNITGDDLSTGKTYNVSLRKSHNGEMGEEGSGDNEKMRFKADAEFKVAQARWRDEAFKAKKEATKYKNAFKELGFEGDVEAAVIRAKADKTGISEDELKAERDALRESIRLEERESIEHEVQKKLAEREILEIRNRDLKAIKAKYPIVVAKEIGELGAKFETLMASGEFSAIEAYELAFKPPKDKKEIGSTQGATIIEKDFFTVDEVNAMTKSEVAKYYDKIEKSRTKWK